VIFLDSSVLVRRYGGRRPAPWPAEPFCVSALARLEVASAFHRLVRESRRNRSAAEAALRRLALDGAAWHEVPVDAEVLREAGALVARRPLRSLDAVHLASALVLARLAPRPPRFATGDAALAAAARAEGLEVADG
jgi:predicted nucleic acid-binding protein